MNTRMPIISAPCFTYTLFISFSYTRNKGRPLALNVLRKNLSTRQRKTENDKHNVRTSNTTNSVAPPIRRIDNEINDLPASVQIQITLKTPPNLRCKTTAAIGNK